MPSPFGKIQLMHVCQSEMVQSVVMDNAGAAVRSIWITLSLLFVFCLEKRPYIHFGILKLALAVHYKACGRSGNSKSGCLQKIMMLCGEIRMWLATWDAFYFFNKPCWIITWSSPGVAATHNIAANIMLRTFIHLLYIICKIPGRAFG